MNSRRISVILLAVNFVLLGTLAYVVYATRIQPPVAPELVQTRVVTNTITQIAVRKINSTNLLAALANRPLHWHAIESTNYVVYIENLRNFGCPDETIRDIILTDIAKLYARRRAELRALLKPYKYWETGDPVTGTPGATPELQRKVRELDREQRQLVRVLLDVDFRTEIARYWNDEDPLERDYSYLPPDKQDRLQSVMEKYQDLEQELYGRSRGLVLAADQEELKQIQRHRRAELAAFLTPDELENYDVRHSETANTMRSQLAGFQPSEEEFRKIFRLQKAFDESFDQSFDTRDESAMAIKSRAADDAQDALSGEVKAILGPQRFAEYQRAQDGDYRSLLQVAERFEVPPEAANKVYNVKQAAEQYKLQVESNPALTDEQRARAMVAIARESERFVSTTLGSEAFQAYQQTGGQWLGNLTAVDEVVVPHPPLPPPTGTTLPYDINLLPPTLRAYLLDPRMHPMQPK